MQDDIDGLIDELLARELRPNTRVDLVAFRREAAAGTLSSDDARYIRALHGRVVGGGAPLATATDDDEDDEQSSEVESLRTALAESQQKERTLAAECQRLQAQVADLRRELEALKAGKG